MGKKKNQSLTERIAALINRVGEKPEPTFSYIKSELVACLGIAETLENGAAVGEAEAKITALEAALEKSETAREEANAALEQSSAELGKLKGELQTAKAEIQSFRVEQKERDKKERDIPEVQFKILKRLPSENGGIAWKLSEISYVAGIPVDEAEIHIKRLEIHGLIRGEWGHSAKVWHRTISGTELVLAKRLADEEEERCPKRHKHADLRKDAHEALLLIARSEEGIEEFELTQRCGNDALRSISALCSAQFASSETGIRGLRAPRIFMLAKNGAEYLAERDLLEFPYR